MDKRKFLKSTIGVGALAVPGAAAANPRLFGNPGSVIPINLTTANRIRLTMGRLHIPVEIWEKTISAITAIQEIFVSPAAQVAFAGSPTAYFEQRGLPAGTFAQHSRDLAMARLAVDSIARRAAEAGDYPAFLHRLKEFNLGTMPNPDGLIEQIARLMKDDVAFYKSISSALNQELDPREPAMGSIGAKIGPEDTVAIDTDVLAMESVIVMIHAVIGAEVFVLAAVVATIVIVVAGTEPGGGSLQGSVVDPKLARLDPDTIEFATNATIGARILGNKLFEVAIAKDLVRREIEALLGAGEKVGMITIPESRRKALTDLAFQKACEGLGLA